MRIVSSDHAGEWPIAKSRPVARVPTWEVHRYLYGVTTKLKPDSGCSYDLTIPINLQQFELSVGDACSACNLLLPWVAGAAARSTLTVMFTFHMVLQACNP